MQTLKEGALEGNRTYTSLASNGFMSNSLLHNTPWLYSSRAQTSASGNRARVNHSKRIEHRKVRSIIRNVT
jgi:hypothetical protein